VTKVTKTLMESERLEVNDALRKNEEVDEDDAEARTFLTFVRLR
jgi:hypothetical protein